MSTKLIGYINFILSCLSRNLNFFFNDTIFVLIIHLTSLISVNYVEIFQLRHFYAIVVSTPTLKKSVSVKLRHDLELWGCLLTKIR